MWVCTQIILYVCLHYRCTMSFSPSLHRRVHIPWIKREKKNITYSKEYKRELKKLATSSTFCSSHRSRNDLKSLHATPSFQTYFHAHSTVLLSRTVAPPSDQYLSLSFPSLSFFFLYNISRPLLIATRVSMAFS